MRWARYKWQISRFGVVEELERADEALLDFDTGRTAPRLRPFLAVARIVGIRLRYVRLDRTRKGWHVVIRHSGHLTPPETVALQCCFGSDGRREALNLMRVIALRKRRRRHFFTGRWNILYSTKLRQSRGYTGTWKETPHVTV